MLGEKEHWKKYTKIERTINRTLYYETCNLVKLKVPINSVFTIWWILKMEYDDFIG